MKRKSLKYIFILLIGLLMILPNKVSASVNGYTIEKYNIDMVVNENNTFDIIETITANFEVSKHGIIRKIPLKNTVVRNDGTTSKNRVKITNLKVNEKSSVSNNNGFKTIKIGDESKTITGKHTYIISYTYDIGKDPLKDMDELYFNLIGNEWDTSIDNISFKIKMPKEFNKELLGFSSGAKGSTNNSNIIYNVSGNTISGYSITRLKAEEGLNVRLTLPEGYFVGSSNNIDLYSIFVMGLSVICVLIAYALWVKYGKDDIVVETVEFYPPEGFNSAEIGYIYKGKADSESIISLLIYLADKGYLKIEDDEQKGMFGKTKGFKITKLKEYDGNNEYEKIFFAGLFKNGRKSVTKYDLYDSFYQTIDTIKSEINSKENKKKIFETTASGKIKWIILMIMAIFILISFKPIVEYGGLGILPFALIFPGVGLTVSCTMLFSKGSIAAKIFGVMWGLVFGGVPWLALVLPALQEATIYLVTYIVGIICIVILLILLKIMPKRTPIGNELLGKIRGFKRFLETAEKEQLEKLVSQNPEYFYNVLPYTYALEVSDVWIKQFETIALKEPDWYDSTDNFNAYAFGSFMTSTMESVSSAMTSSPSSDSSGGGFSGGGSGGGGGSSW